MIEVLYKDYTRTGNEKLTKEYFRSWNHEGEYTCFYDDVSLESLSLVIPTCNVCWIKINKS